MQRIAATEVRNAKITKRVDVIKALLETGERVTVETLMAKFHTSYKNITGDFYQLRKAGVEISKIRVDGRTFFFC